MAAIDSLLQRAVQIGASDVQVATGSPPIVRRFQQLTRFKANPLTAAQTQHLLYEILTAEQRAIFEKDWELDFAYEIDGLARFRVNAFMQRYGPQICFRVIRQPIPTFEQLGIPELMKKVCDNHQGLILVTGGSGAGKSTTLASMVDFINTHKAHHILTCEDPIEYIHPIKKGAVNQRQLSTHTKSYKNALKAALREDPDVIMVGELRDLETISLAISASETGHLVIGSMNTSSAHKTVDKIIDSYPPEQQNQIKSMLGESLKAVFTQRLLPRADGQGLVMAYELLLGNLQLANLIKDGKTFQIPNIMQMGKTQGMRTMDDSLMHFVQGGYISGDVALRNAANPKTFAQFAQSKAAQQQVAAEQAAAQAAQKPQA
ncbi:MAG: PilT/PilU family type 4a pilus ATPase [Chrysiogenetes bacterium]|nr:PilT/PilU family type 4a pilus ATPase [Chrysiogenetes bacterium]